jgi:hypothetical protein
VTLTHDDGGNCALASLVASKEAAVISLAVHIQNKQLKAKETKKCLHRDVDDDDLVEFCQL